MKIIFELEFDTAFQAGWAAAHLALPETPPPGVVGGDASLYKHGYHLRLQNGQSTEMIGRSHISFVKDISGPLKTNPTKVSIAEKNSNPSACLRPIDLDRLKTAKNSQEWLEACIQIKKEFGGYPSDWFEVVIDSGMAQEILTNRRID